MREKDIFEVGSKGAAKRGLPDKGVGIDSGGAEKSRVAPPQETSESDRASPLEALGSIPNSSNWRERINIEFCQDELDPKILERLPPPSAMVAASVHKYWTTVWAKVTDGMDLHEMIRMAEMNTVQNHVLNCKLFKIFTTMVDELHSLVEGSADIEALHWENKALSTQLTVFEDGKLGSSMILSNLL
ncbi:hypothetical protein Adt_33265 [Abeliophyllum distichum]|uniref:Uncharacterized protein n=1 Tax=Abeliophyllum distichum TaxID=126358 RepID=A0ABD1QWP2_9LAMI